MSNNDLSLIGLHLNAANHLRWSFDLSDGFPLHGFDLYRRDHLASELEWLSFEHLSEEDLRIARWDTPPVISLPGPAFGPATISPVEDPQAGLPLDVLHPGVVDLRHPPGPAVPAGPLRQVTVNSANISGRISAQKIHIQFWGNNQLPALEFSDEVRVVFDQDLSRAELEIVNLSGGDIVLRALQGSLQLSEVRSRPRRGQLARLQIEAPSFNALQVVCGLGLLVDVRAALRITDPAIGWGGPLNGNTPIYLPLSHANYPGRHARFPDDPAEVYARIPLAAHHRLPPARVQEMVAMLEQLVVALPRKGMAQQTWSGHVSSTTPAGKFELPIMQMLFIAALEPPIAQALGMYWIDSAIQPGGSYDYKIAGHWQSPGSADRVEYLTHMRAVPGPPLLPPQGLVATFLQGANMVSNVVPGRVIDAQHNVGLNWSLPLQHGKLGPESPVLYHVERKALPAGDRAAAAAPGGYRRLTSDAPVLAPSSRAIPGKPQWPPGWPEKSMQYIDQAVRPDEYYAYRIRGVDLFGRVSAPSSPAIIRVVRATLPPPAPIITWAKLIQADDPNLTRAEKLWAASNRKLPGLWLSWRWPRELQQQAPDACEFRGYFQVGSFNSLRGNIREVVRVTDARYSRVVLEVQGRLSNSFNDLAGQWLRSGPNSFAIHSSARVQNSLSLRVENIEIAAADPRAAPLYLAPEPGPVSVSIAPGHPAYKEYDQSRQWNRKPLFNQPVIGAREEYEARVEGVPLKLRSWDALVPMQIGLTALDPYGQESEVSPPVTVFAVNRQAPPQPKAPDESSVYATPADYYGYSYYTLRWPNQPDCSFIVYRALDESVFATDRQTYDAGSSPPNYSSLSSRALQKIASKGDNAAAFTPLTDAPIAAADARQRLVEYRDILEGRAGNRYFYRIAAVSPAGVRSGLGPATPPIHLPPVTPPEPPVVTKVQAGDRKIVLRWNAAATAAAKEYRIYRSEDERSSEDIRLMRRIATVAHENQQPPDEDMLYEDEQLAGPQLHYYRMTAVDAAENESEATALFMAKAYSEHPPEPPVWEAAGWEEAVPGRAPAIALRWKTNEPGAKAILQRRTTDQRVWEAITPWLRSQAADGRTFTHRDEDVEAEGYYEYRVKVVDRFGQGNAWFDATVVGPAAGGAQ